MKKVLWDEEFERLREELRGDPLVKSWLSGRAPSTADVGLRGLAYFLHFSEATTRNLLELGYRDPEGLKLRLESFIDFLFNCGLAPVTAARYVQEVRSFLMHHSVVPPQRIRATLTKPRPPSPDWLPGAVKIRDPEILSLFKHPTVEKWLRQFADSPNTLTTYLYYFNRFVKWSGMNPDDYIEMAHRDMPRAFSILKDFYSHLLTKVASKTASCAFSTVRSFLVWNDLHPPRTPRRFKAYREHEPEYTPTPEDVARMVDAATNLRDKAVIAFLPQSGQRVRVLTALRYKHVKDDLEAERVPIIVRVPEVLLAMRGINVNKNRVSYKFALGGDAAYFLKLMIEERRRQGEEITDDSWLFRGYAYLPEGSIAPRRVPRGAPGPPISTQRIREIVHRAAWSAGIQRKGPGKIYRIHPHVFRRFFNTQLRSAGVDRIDREYLLGHRLPYAGAYDKYTYDYIRRMWISKRLDYWLGISRPSPTKDILDLMTLCRDMGLDPDKVLEDATRRMREAGGARKLEEALRVEMLEAMRRKMQSSGGLPIPKKPRQMVVEEDELEQYLAEGYEAVMVLPSGRVILRLP